MDRQWSTGFTENISDGRYNAILTHQSESDLANTNCQLTYITSAFQLAGERKQNKAPEDM